MSSVTPVEVAVSLPFKISASGLVSYTTDSARIWADRVRSVIGTLASERVMRPEFGTLIPTRIFDSVSTTQDQVASDIRLAFARYLPKLTVEDVSTSFNAETNVVYATIEYSLPNQDKVTTSLGIASISGTKLLTQESK